LETTVLPIHQSPEEREIVGAWGENTGARGATPHERSIGASERLSIRRPAASRVLKLAPARAENRRSPVVSVDMRKPTVNASSRCRSLIGRLRRGPGAGAESRDSRRPTACQRAASQSGFLLIEVIISSLLVAIIVIGTFTGFDEVTSSTSDQRNRNAATLLAAQSQEALRSDPATTLEALALAPHTYAKALNGTTYSITQSAEPIDGSGGNATCTATESESGSAPNIRITSSVTWNQRKGSAVVQSSVITPPVGSALEVDVDNNEPPTAGIAGVSAVIRYVSIDTNRTVTREGTTSSAGCVVFGSVRSDSAIVEIVQKPNFVTPSGALKIAPAEVTIAPNLTTHYVVTYNEGGAIEANFTYKGGAATGDTFVVSNSQMGIAPEFQVGSTAFGAFEAGELQHYTVKTGTYSTTKAQTAKGSKYTQGDLFPFAIPPESEWSVFAGDCMGNNPTVVTGGVVNAGSGIVAPGTTTPVNVPMSHVTLELWEGTKAAHTTHPTTTYPIKITNKACTATTAPNNSTGLVLEHLQRTLSGGHLEAPFQPFGKAELCLTAGTAPNTRAIKDAYLNKTTEGSSFSIFLGELSVAEKTAARKAEETSTKTAREKTENEAPAHVKRVKEEETQTKARENEEKVTRPARESSETTLKNAKTSEEAAKATREAKEKTEREKWLKEESKHEISEATRKAKEATQKTARVTAESNETTAKAKRTTEETALKETKEKEETAKTKRVSEEGATKTTREGEEKATAIAAGNEHTKFETQEKAETKEATEQAAEGITVEALKSTC
jgi:Tfp pilus assembly protein PilV